MAENIGDAFVRVHARDGGLDDDIERMFGKLDLHDEGKDAGKDWGDGVDEGAAERAPEESILDRFKAMGERLTRLALEGKEVQFDEEVDLLKEHLNETEHLEEESSKTRERNEKDSGERRSKNRFRNFQREHALLNRIIGDTEKFGDVAGRLTGHGSRNDFLNIIGSSARNLVRSLAILPKLISPVTDAFAFMFKGFADGFKSGEGLFSSFGKGIAGMASSAASIGAVALPALAAFVAAAVAAVAVLGALVSIASGLLAGITAVVASLSFAIIGGLGLLAGAIAPIGFAIAGLAAAFVGLDDKTKATLKTAVQPLIGGIKELGAEVRKPILGVIIGQSKALGGLFSSLTPLFHGVGQSIAQTIRLMVRELTGPGGTSFFSAMTKAMPHAIVDLGEIFVHTFGGFGGIMVGLIPSFQRLLDSLEGITFRFSNFTNSAKGQNAIKRFMDDAVESAKSLGRLLLETGGLLGDLFTAGRGTGNTIIDDLTAKVHDFRNFLAANPNGLKEWFANGLDTVRSAGNVIRDIAKALASLDTPDNRRLGAAIFGALRIGIGLVATQFKLLTPLVKGFIGVIDSIKFAVGGGLFSIGLLIQGFALMADAASHLPFIGDKFKDIADGMHDAADNVKGLGEDLMGLPDPQVDSGPATAGIKGLKGEADSLTSPQITPDMDIDPALADRDRLALGLEQMNSPVIVPEVDTGPAHTGLDGLRDDADTFTSPVIEPQADTSKAGHDLGRLRNDIGEATSKNFVFRAVAEVANAKKDLGELRNAVPGGRGDNRPLKINIEAHAENARKQIGALRKDMDGARSPVDLKVRTGSALGAVTGLRKGIEKIKPKDVNLGARTGAALQAVTGLRKGIENVKDKTTKIDTRTEQAKKNAKALEDAIGKVKDKSTTMNTRTSQAQANVDRLRASISNLHDRTVTITTIRNETTRIRREQVPLPGSGGQAPLAPSTGFVPRGVSTGKTVNVNQLTLVSNSPHPRTVANEFLNSLVAASL